MSTADNHDWLSDGPRGRPMNLAWFCLAAASTVFAVVAYVSLGWSATTATSPFLTLFVPVGIIAGAAESFPSKYHRTVSLLRFTALLYTLFWLVWL